MTRHSTHKHSRLLAITALSLAGIVASACSSDNDDGDTGSSTPDVDVDVEISGLDPDNFVNGALASDPTIVDCTLSDGTETTCYEIVTVGVPADAAVGPFCPANISSTSDEAGIWLDGTGIVYEANGDFILDLPNIYGDSNWQLYDVDTGDVNITDTQEACELAANPNVDEAYQNYCVECSLDYVDGGLSQTFTIPVTPVPADTTGQLSQQVGISLNGIQLAAPAPVANILAAYTIAAFDDCGGHVNPNEGYHYHAATGCTEASGAVEADGHASLLGYALDGYGIYGELDSDGNATDGLDQCRGISDDIRGYHYHAASAGDNMFIGCFTGKTVASEEGQGGPGGGPPQ